MNKLFFMHISCEFYEDFAPPYIIAYFGGKIKVIF